MSALTFNTRPRTAVHLALVLRDGDGCFYCGCWLDDELALFDHVVPRSAGGSNGIENLVRCCSRCNSAKGDRPAWFFVLTRELRVSVHRPPRPDSTALARLRCPSCDSLIACSAIWTHRDDGRYLICGCGTSIVRHSPILFTTNEGSDAA